MVAGLTYDAAEPKRKSVYRTLTSEFWRFFVVALLFDVGFGLYFFLINLYLAQIGTSERTIGMVAGALTLGNVAATMPFGIVARKIGLRPLLVFCLIVAPLVATARVFEVSPVFQTVLAFWQGATMCGYAVCFAPAVAALTDTSNRTAAFTLTFGTGIGSGVVCGLVGGAAPVWLRSQSPTLTNSAAMACVLVAGCGIALSAAIPLRKLKFAQLSTSRARVTGVVASLFARRFLGMVAVWNLAIGAFAPFATIYLSGSLHIPLPRIGLLFAAGQLLQVIGVGVAPFVYRRFGTIYGIAAVQGGACVALVLLYSARAAHLAIAAYLCTTTFQYMCNPAIYSVWMDETSEELREAASAIQALITSCAVATGSVLSGTVITSRGYGVVFVGCACLSTAGACVTCMIKQPSQTELLTERAATVELQSR